MQFYPRKDVWKITGRDLQVFSLSLLGIALFSFLLYRNFSQSVDASSGERIGTLIIKRNIAQRKLAQQVFWEQASNRLALFNQDAIRTGKFSSALIRLDGATEIDVDSDTYIILDVSQEEVNIDFSYGSLSARRSKEDVQEQEFDEDYSVNIKSKDQTISIQDSDLQLDKGKEEDRLSLVVSRGQANITTASGQQQVVGKNERALLNRDKIEVEKISLVPNLPEDGQHLFTAQKSQPVTFRWEKETRVSQVTLEVSSEKDFSQLAAEKRVGGLTTRLNLPTGTFYWRLSAENPASREREYSTRYKLSIVASSPIELYTPTREAKIDYVEELPQVQFSWSSNQIASSYRLEVASEPKFDNIVFSRSASATALAANLEEGDYFWRVRSQSDISEGEEQSKVSQFRISKLEKVAPPLLKSPPPGRRLFQAALKGRGVIFGWDSSPEVREAELSIAQDENFEQIVLQERLRRDYFKLRRTLNSGRYYWRVRGLRRETAFSRSSSFTVLEQQALSLVAFKPVDRATFRMDREIKFQWKRPEVEGLFELIIARDSTFNNVTLTRKIEENDLRIGPWEEEGLYYWRVRLLDIDGSNLALTQTRRFEIVPYVEILSLRSGREIRGLITDMKNGRFHVNSESGLIKIDVDDVSNIRQN